MEFKSVTLSENPLMVIFNDPDYSDVTLLIEDKPLHVIKKILIAHSETFRIRLSKFSEAGSNTLTITEPGITYELFSEFIGYLYGCPIQLTETEDTLQLLHLSDYYQVHALFEACKEFISERISKENASAIYASVNPVSCSSILQKCINLFFENLDENREHILQILDYEMVVKYLLSPLIE